MLNTRGRAKKGNVEDRRKKRDCHFPEDSGRSDQLLREFRGEWKVFQGLLRKGAMVACG